jgi:hypothetical protein
MVVPTLLAPGIAAGVSQILTKPLNGSTLRVEQAQQALEEFLGPGATRVESTGSDLMLRSANGTRVVRFDLQNSHGLNPHINIELKAPRNLYPGDQRMITVDNFHVFPK